MSEPTCATCIFYESMSENEGLCLEGPPTPFLLKNADGNDTVISAFPPVGGETKCGRFTPQPVDSGKEPFDLELFYDWLLQLLPTDYMYTTDLEHGEFGISGSMISDTHRGWRPMEKHVITDHLEEYFEKRNINVSFL